MGKKIAGTLIVSAVLAAGTSAANAAVIYENTITGTNPNTANPYTTGQTFDPNITVSGIGRGSGIVGTNANNRYNANSWNTAGIDTTAYFSWTLSPNSGYSINFTSLTGNWQSSSTGANAYAVRTSLDGFSSNIVTGAVTTNATSAFSIDLSAATFDDITSPITFQLHAWGASAATGTFSVNDFIFDGAVAAAGSAPTISLSNSALAGFTNIASGGQVDLVVDANTIVESEIDGLTANAAKGAAVLAPLPPSTMSKVYVLLWLLDTNTGNGTTIDGLVNALDTAGAIISDNDGDADTVALQSKWNLFQSGIYSGFNVLVQFDSPGAFDRVNWDFVGFTDIVVDQIAVIPEPASLGLLALGGLALLGRRRK